MAQALRVLLWTAVIVAPGGVFLLPLLAADALRQRERRETVPVASAVDPVRRDS